MLWDRLLDVKWIAPEQQLFSRNGTVEDVFIGLVHCSEYCPTFHLLYDFSVGDKKVHNRIGVMSFQLSTKKCQTKLISKLPGPCKGLHCLWYRPTAKECCLKHNIIKTPVSAYSRWFTTLCLPSPSGLSMLYSGIHSRNNSSISTAFFSVNLNQNQIG